MTWLQQATNLLHLHKAEDLEDHDLWFDWALRELQVMVRPQIAGRLSDQQFLQCLLELIFPASWYFAGKPWYAEWPK